jgi:hypothetical protein
MDEECNDSLIHSNYKKKTATERQALIDAHWQVGNANERFMQPIAKVPQIKLSLERKAEN